MVGGEEVVADQGSGGQECGVGVGRAALDQERVDGAPGFQDRHMEVEVVE